MVGLGVMEIAILGVVCVLPVIIGSVVLIVVLTKKAAAASGGGITCVECSAPIPPDSRFCPKCGRATTAK